MSHTIRIGGAPRTPEDERECGTPRMGDSAVRPTLDFRERLAIEIRTLRDQVEELSHQDRELHGCEDASGRVAADYFAAKELLAKALNDYFDISEHLEGRGGTR